MLRRKCSQKRFLVLLCVIVISTKSSLGMSSKGPSTWWPDPSTGLMWTGQSNGFGYINWQRGNEFCSALRLGGYSDWRLPTLTEIRSITISYHYDPNVEGRENPTYPKIPYNGAAFKGGIVAQGVYIWTSTPAGDQKVWTESYGYPAGEMISKVTTGSARQAICTRAMEPELIPIAQQAQVTSAVPDIATLKADVLLGQAEKAYQAGQYESSLAQAQSALQAKPGFASAEYAVGISYGMLGQWDSAVTNLQAAKKAGDDDAKAALKWAQDGQKAAKKGQTLKDPSPTWK
jgi:hypothetical protein